MLILNGGDGRKFGLVLFGEIVIGVGRFIVDERYSICDGDRGGKKGWVGVGS